MKRNNNFYTRFLFLVFSGLTVLLVINILYLTLTGKHFISGRDISAYGETQGEREETLYASRGKIYSYDGAVIAEDKTVYQLKAYIDENRPSYPGQIAYVDDPAYAARELAPILGTTEEYILTQLTREGGVEASFGSAGANLTGLQKEKIENLGINGLEFVAHTQRIYYYNHFSSYVVGYARPDPNGDNKKLVIGEMGIERVMNNVLTGTDGSVVYLTNSSQTYSLPNSVIREKLAVDGSDVYLSFDSNLQNMLEIRLERFLEESTAERVWCGVMEAKTGRMLAMSSWPDFNLNELVIDNYTNYFFDYAYEVGSVMKPFVYAEAINQNVYNGQALYQSGTVWVGEDRIKDWNTYGWGSIPYDEGLIHSSNTAIVSLINDVMNKDQYIQSLYDLGFFSSYELDGFNTASGQNNLWTGSVIDTVSIGFGQASSVTPIQLMRAYSVFANDGKMVNPYIVSRVVNADGNVEYVAKTTYSDQIYSTEAVAHVSELLKEVVNNTEIGTGTPYQMDDVIIAGKTGTGEIADTVEGGYIKGQMSYSFVGMAPYDDPAIIIMIGCQGPTDTSNSKKMGEVVKYMTNLSLSTLNYSGNEISVDVKEIELPSYTNQSIDYVKKQLNTNRFETVVVGDGSVIIGQYPNKGVTVSNTDTIFLLSDASQYIMPDMTGWSRKNAINYLSLLNVIVDYRNDASTVTSQSLASGEIIEMGTTIILNE